MPTTTDSKTKILMGGRPVWERVLHVIPTRADGKTNGAADTSTAAHQNLQPQREDGHIHLVDWTCRVTAIEKKKAED